MAFLGFVGEGRILSHLMRPLMFVTWFMRPLHEEEKGELFCVITVHLGFCG